MAQVKKIDKWYRLLITDYYGWDELIIRRSPQHAMPNCPACQEGIFHLRKKQFIFYNKIMCLGWWQYIDIILEVFGFCQRFAALFYINRKEYLCEKAKRQWHLICNYLTWPYRVPGCCRWSACSRRTLQTLPCCQSWQLSASPSLSPQSCVFCV